MSLFILIALGVVYLIGAALSAIITGINLASYYVGQWEDKYGPTAGNTIGFIVWVGCTVLWPVALVWLWINNMIKGK